MAELLKATAESLGVSVNKNYIDIIEVREVEEKTGDEIALDVIKRAGLKVR